MSIFGNLDGKTAVVCGASHGLGAATAQALASLGSRVILVARSREALETLRKTLPHPERHCSVSIDLSDLQAVAKFAADQASRKDPVHILINNAGGPTPGAAMMASPEGLLEGINMHVLANVMLCQAFVPQMKDANYGRIINIVSVSARNPVANLAVSNTVRGAVLNWAKTLSRELAPYGITVNSVLPGYTDTARLQQILANNASQQNVTKAAVEERLLKEIPMGRFGRAEELAAAVAYFALPAASFTTGTTLAVDGGWTSST